MLDAMARAVHKWKVGMGTEDGAIFGPVQNEMQYRKVRRLFEEVKQKGYVAKVGGEVKETKGFFLEPTIIDNPPPSSPLVTEEQFVRTRTHPPTSTLTNFQRDPSCLQFLGPARRKSFKVRTIPRWA